MRTANPLIVSFGAGNNSTAMLIGMAERTIRPDAILFADTRGEKPETYAHIWRFNQWLLDHDMPSITIVHKGGSNEGLEDVCLRLKRLPSIAIGSRICSHRFKVEPQNKWVGHWPVAQEAWAAGLKVVKYIGFHAGEHYRVLRVSEKEDGKYDYRYPLMEWGWTGDDCTAAVERAGLSTVVKSACFFCPSSKRHEVLALRDQHPELFARALEIERRALADGLHTVKGLGRHWSWDGLAKADAAQMKMFPDTVSVPCVCFDGDAEGG